MSATADFRKLIEFAILEEKQAQKIYRSLAAKARDPFAKAILLGLQEEECGHEEKLKSLLATVDPAHPRPKPKKSARAATCRRA